jgi:siroheme synthase-like protein
VVCELTERDTRTDADVASTAHGAASWSYPVFLDLRGRRCVVVGGGELAAGKARDLRAAGARVTVVAARPGPAIEALASSGDVRLRRRPYRTGDLAGAFLAIAAGDEPAEREAVWREATRRGLPLNSVDDPPRCSFIAPAVVRRGALAVAISTAGRAPALAVRLRQWLEGELGHQHARFLALAGSVRAALAARQPDLALRRELWYTLVDSDALELLRRGDETGARRRFAEILGVEPPAAGAEGAD